VAETNAIQCALVHPALRHGNAGRCPQKYALNCALGAVRDTTVVGMDQSSTHHTPTRHEILYGSPVATQCLLRSRIFVCLCMFMYVCLCIMISRQTKLFKKAGSHSRMSKRAGKWYWFTTTPLARQEGVGVLCQWGSRERQYSKSSSLAAVSTDLVNAEYLGPVDAAAVGTLILLPKD
jgi:hypothetical protein